MVMPTEPTTQFVVVKTDLALAFLEENLNRPTQTAESHQLAEGQVSRAIAEVVFDLGRVGEVAPQHQPEFFMRHAGAGFNDPLASEFADDGSLASLLDGHRRPGSWRQDQGQRVNPLRRFTLGMEAQTFAPADGPSRHALRFGVQKINLHPAVTPFEPKAAHPGPGTADLCFLSDTPLADWQAHLAAKGIAVEDGPVPRTGATGPILSLYLRDPDGT